MVSLPIDKLFISHLIRHAIVESGCLLYSSPAHELGPVSLGLVYFCVCFCLFFLN